MSDRQTDRRTDRHLEDAKTREALHAVARKNYFNEEMFADYYNIGEYIQCLCISLCIVAVNHLDKPDVWCKEVSVLRSVFYG